ncbi:UDP-glucose 4-epimerase GalE [Chitinimonas sp.]|uniref:UDP-glucose 4-epimerase GalE n=1 Tax=Chitinimonas sp. TaxID=1934313 RepID=UPI002F91E8EF
MRILVTGASGYAGSHLSVALCLAGHQVIGLDNYCNSAPTLLAPLCQLAGSAFQFVEGDVGDTATLRALFLRHQPELVMHLAATLPHTAPAAITVFRRNVSDLIALLNVMDRFAVRRLVFCSSATVYGEPGDLPTREGDPVEPQDSYARSKAFCEQMLRDLATANPDWHILQLRPFNLIGSHASGQLPAGPQGSPNLLERLRQAIEAPQRPLRVEGDDYASADGSAIRDYLHVCDFAEACKAALPLLAQPCNLTLNIGSGTGHSVYQVMRAYAQCSRQAIPFEIAPRRPGSPAVLYGDCRQARQLLHWRPSLGLEEICAESWRLRTARTTARQSAALRQLRGA